MTFTARLALAATALVPLLGAVAHADTALAPTPFVTLDRDAGDSAVALEIRYPTFASGTGAGTLLAADLTARYVDPASHFGGYINIPLNYVGGLEGDDSTGASSSNGSLGDIELGGIYALQTPIPELAVIAHAGILLPTSSQDNAFINAVSALVTRPSEIYAALPGITLHAGISPVIRSGMLFARADVDLDVNVWDRGDSGTADPLLTVAAGAGIQLPQLALAGELTAVHLFESDLGITTSSTLYTAAVTARYTAGQAHPYVAVQLPLDQDSRDLVDVVVIGGISIALR
jgi:hypothetical protein